MNIPRQYSLVTCEMEEGSEKHYPFVVDKQYIFYGEIPNMEGHCIVAEYYSGRLYSGYHTEMFTEVPEDDMVHTVGFIDIDEEDEDD